MTAPAGPVAPPSERIRRRLWPHLRAAFVVFHVCAVLLAASPSTASTLRRSAWDDPTVKAEFAAWAPRFGLPPDELADRLWSFAVRYNAVRAVILAPFVPYLRWAEVGQSWQMFVAPHTWPTRLSLEERIGPAGGGDDEWRPLFVERDPEHRWMAGALGVERLRASIFRWGWSAYGVAYREGCHGLAARRFAEAPEVRAFRCRFYKARTPSVAELAAGERPEGRWVLPIVVERP